MHIMNASKTTCFQINVSLKLVRINRFATEEQLSLFMDSLWSLITLISSFIGKKYLGYFFCIHVILIGLQVTFVSLDL